MRSGYERRRTTPTANRRWVGLIMILVAAFVALAALAWQQSGQIRALQVEVAALQQELRVTHLGQEAFQGTAATMENRLALLEANDPETQIAALRASLDSADGSEQYDELRASLQDIQARVDSFQAALDALSARMVELQSSDPAYSDEPLPAEAWIAVTPQRQSHNLSCESAAASMVADYHGLSLTEAEVLAALPLNDNPHLGFRGNVDGPTGSIVDYGVYAEPIQTILNRRGLWARPIDGGLSGVKAAIARGNPVIVWVTYNCLLATPTTLAIEGEMVTLVPNQHVVVVTGYSATGVWANDPWDGEQDYYPNADFERAMGYFGNMALEVAGP